MNSHSGMQKPEGYPLTILETTSSSSSSSSYGTYNDATGISNEGKDVPAAAGFSFEELCAYYDKYQSGAANDDDVDPRLLALLEYYKELYIQRQEVVKKIFPGLQDEFAELCKRFSAGLAQVKSKNEERSIRSINSRTVLRSLSFGSPRTPPKKKAVESPVLLERFKIRTVLQSPSGQGRDQTSNNPKMPAAGSK